MFDVAPSEFFIVALVALVVIGPKDLPRAMRVVGYWVGKARGVARQFRSGFDEMVRESELAEMEKKWAAENARIMAEHSPGALLTGPDPATQDVDAALAHGDEPDLFAPPVTVEKPVVAPAPAGTPPAADAKADS